MADSRTEADRKQNTQSPSDEDARGDPSVGQLRRWDLDHLWHPFTPQKEYPDTDPLMIGAADGHYLIDVEGNRYLDGISSLGTNLLGHRRPELDKAVSTQLGQVAHATLFGNATDVAVRLARRLVEVAPDGLTRVFFSEGTAGAVEVALKMAYQY